MLMVSQPAAGQTSPCATGGAVAHAANNPGLVSDCDTLLAARDTLAGTATLDWFADTAETKLYGVSLGNPSNTSWSFVSSHDLNGKIPVTGET